MLRIASGTAYTFTGLDQRTLLFLYQGSGTAGGVQLVERDGVLLDPGESVDLAADADLAFLIVGLPRVAEVAAAAETVTAQVPGSRVASNA
jgi:redox-sensitive bicupin YhaK (pirin superfamily)